MSLPRISTREEWRAARIDLLKKEKELTQHHDALATERRELPMVEVTKDYRFEGPSGPVGLADLFEGRRQLIVYHFMFHPEWDEGCSGCTAGQSEVSQGFLDHLHTRDTTYVMASRAPLAKLQAWSAKQGFVVPWYSTNDGDFSYDFGVTIDESRGYDEYNYRSVDEYVAQGEPSWRDTDQPYDNPGQTCFLRDGDRIFHTYSVFARGLESTGGSYYFLDNTALGRQEDWEEPKGRSDNVRPGHPGFES